MNIEEDRRHLQTRDGIPMACRIHDILLEAFLTVMVATILPTSLLLGVGFLLMWKKFHAPCISHTQNHYNCFKLSTTCTTCRLAILALLLLCESHMTSAKMRKVQRQPYYECDRAERRQNRVILKPQLQLYYKCDRVKMTHNNEILTKQKAMKSSRALRRLGKILQYNINDLRLPFPHYWSLGFTCVSSDTY